MATTNQLVVKFDNPYFPGPVSAPSSRPVKEPDEIAEGDVVWTLVRESPLDRRGSRAGASVACKPQRMCGLAYASAAWGNIVGKTIQQYNKTARSFTMTDATTVIATDLSVLMGKIMAHFDWRPDGVVLSTSEDTADFAHPDSTGCNLINVCVQGPAVAKCWSANSALQTKAGDTLYLLATVALKADPGGDPNLWVVDTDNTCIRPATSRQRKEQLVEQMKALRSALDVTAAEFVLNPPVVGWKIGTVIDSAASKIGGVVAKKRGRAPVAVKCAVSLQEPSAYDMLRKLSIQAPDL